MKNILVPIDFSECSFHALEFAYAMAEIYDSNVFIYHNIDTKTSFWPSLTSEKVLYEEKQEIRRLIEAELKKTVSESPMESDRLKAYYAEGDLSENINDSILKNNIDFVIMGSHGVSGKKEFFIGSNTQKVVRSVNCSVFVVKNPIKDFKISKVVFASNFYPSDVISLKYALNFLKPFMPEIHLVEVNTPGFYSQPYTLEKESMKEFKEMCEGFTCKTHFFKDWSVESGIRHITEKIGADMIIISNNQHHPIRHFLRGSNVEFLVNHADVPVLSINTNDENNV